MQVECLAFMIVWEIFLLMQPHTIEHLSIHTHFYVAVAACVHASGSVLVCAATRGTKNHLSCFCRLKDWGTPILRFDSHCGSSYTLVFIMHTAHARQSA